MSRGRDVYLTGGEPDLWLPDGDGLSQLDVAVDGVARHANGDIVRLCALRLGEGAHEVRLGPISQAFSTQRTDGEVAPCVDQLLGHAVRRNADTSAAGTLDASVIGDRHNDIIVIGATITKRASRSEGADQRDDPQRPVVLPVGAVSCVVLGAMPGEIAWPPGASRKPAWMEVADLTYRVYEYYPTFPIVWILTERRLAPTHAVRLRSPAAPGPIPERRTDRVRMWAMTLLEWTPPEDPVQNALWDSYMDRAEMALEP